MSSYSEKRIQMVNDQLVPRGISDSRVIEAMPKVPKHKFLPDHLCDYAHSDGPLPTGMGQTISQPYVMAFMTELLYLKKGDKVLEIWTGSGYQSVILAEIVCEVYTIDIVESLVLKAKIVLQELGYKNIQFKIGDGYMGWKENAPFNAVIVTAVTPKIPKPIIEHLEEGGKMVLLVGDYFQQLLLLKNTKDCMKEKRVTPVRFIPMTGEAQKHHK